jgi:hypothetical protein
MNLIKFNHREDFGNDWYIQIINIKRFSLLQISVSWNDYPSWPYLQIKSGTGDVLDILFWAYKFGIDITILGSSWCWDHLEDIEVDGEEEEDVQYTS